MKISSKKIIKYFLAVVTLSIYLIFLMFLNINDIGDGYKITIILPIIFWICFFGLLWDPLVNNKTPYLIIFSAISFIRYVILSLSIVCSSDYLGISRKPPSSESLYIAAVLMIWELISVSIFIRYLSNKMLKFNIKKEKNITSYANINVYIGFVLISTIMILIIPQARYGLSFFGSINRSINDDVGSAFILGIRECFINSKYFILFIVIIIANGRENYKINKNKLLKYLIIFFVASMLIGLRIGTNRKKIIADALSIMLLISNMYPKYKKFTTILIGSIGVLLFSSTTVFRGMTNSIGTLFSDYFKLETLQPYFLGQYNIAIAIEALDYFPNMLDYKTYLFSFLRPIFGIGLIIENIDFIRVAELFNLRLSIGMSTIRHDQILPMIAEGYMLYGFILSPIISIIVAGAGIVFDKLYLNSEKIEIVFISSLISFYLGQGMILNGTIILNVLSYALAIYMTIVVVAYMSNKKYKKGDLISGKFK